MSRMIDADALEQELNRIYDKYLHPNDNHPFGTPYGGQVVGDVVRHFRKWVKKNGVDAVPVVRCKDCMYWKSGENESEKWEWCTIHEINIGPHSFCSYGNRKDGDGDE